MVSLEEFELFMQHIQKLEEAATSDTRSFTCNSVQGATTQIISAKSTKTELSTKRGMRICSPFERIKTLIISDTGNLNIEGFSNNL